MPSWLGKLRLKAQELQKKNKQKTWGQEREKKRRTDQSHRASGYYRLSWDLPMGRQTRRVPNEIGAAGLRLLLKNLKAQDVSIQPIEVRRGNKSTGQSPKYEFEVGWAWAQPSGAMDIGNEVSLVAMKQKLKLAGAANVRSVFKPPARDKVQSPKAQPVAKAQASAQTKKKTTARLSR
jgi:hypothetical protein